MTASRTIDPAVTHFLTLLAAADSVDAESPLLTSWETCEPTGDASNEVVLLSWVDEDCQYDCRLTEGAIAEGKWAGSSFFCKDHEGEDAQITLYKHAAIAPPACKQCDSALHGQYCSDQTCFHSDWPQCVPVKDIETLSTEEIEAKHGVKKRVRNLGEGE